MFIYYALFLIYLTMECYVINVLVTSFFIKENLAALQMITLLFTQNYLLTSCDMDQETIAKVYNDCCGPYQQHFTANQ